MCEKRLEDRVAIVTGGARGIGQGICFRFADEGAKVAVFDVTPDEAKEVAGEIKKSGGAALALKVDVTKAAEIEKAVKEVISKFGKVDILVNNAGITRPSKVADMTDEVWDSVVEVNLKGVFLCCRAVIPHMKAQKYGKIVSIASILAQRGGPYYAHYGATKAGVVSFTQSLAIELGRHNINVNAVGPGIIDTPMAAGDVASELQQSLIKRIPLRRIGTPRDIADAALFLASDEAAYITGQCLYVCGGWSAAAGLG
ncbi:MAG: SDR family oxidoreductase [Chloroflexi bacterium]|nr:SDR family oxidoreductase [Chloroflexota bacterium]